MSYIGTVSRPAVNNIIPDNSITAAKIVDGAIVAADLAENSVGTSELDIANITGVLPVGVTGGSGLTSPLQKAGGTMTGTIAGFTSTGIDDNATSNAITIDSSGRVTKPYQPAFFAKGSPTVTSNYVHSFGTVHHNMGSHYVNSTGRFTAPVAGRYLFSCGIWAVANTNTMVGLQINQAGDWAAFHVYTSAAASGAVTAVLEMAVNDYVSINCHYSIQGSSPRNYFSGILIG